MKLKYLLILVLPLILYRCESCVEKWYFIKVNNKSPKTVLVTAGSERYLMTPFPDTLLPGLKPSLFTVQAGDYTYLRSSFDWEKVINDMPADTLSVYFFDPDTVNSVPWIDVCLHYKVMKRIDYSIQDLKSKNWVITYQ